MSDSVSGRNGGQSMLVVLSATAVASAAAAGCIAWILLTRQQKDDSVQKGVRQRGASSQQSPAASASIPGSDYDSSGRDHQSRRTGSQKSVQRHTVDSPFHQRSAAASAAAAAQASMQTSGRHGNLRAPGESGGHPFSGDPTQADGMQGQLPFNQQQYRDDLQHQRHQAERGSTQFLGAHQSDNRAPHGAPPFPRQLIPNQTISPFGTTAKASFGEISSVDSVRSGAEGSHDYRDSYMGNSHGGAGDGGDAESANLSNVQSSMRSASVPEPSDKSSASGMRGAATRSRSWTAIEAAFPVGASQLRVQDIEVCSRPTGELWKLGNGSFGTVYKAMKNGVQPVAVKVIAFDASDKQRADFEKEVKILESCRDRNIVQFLGSCADGNQTLLVTEFMDEGDLLNALRRDEAGELRWHVRQQHNLSEGDRPWPGRGKQIALDIARGIAFLHTHRIVHMDIKSPNVLLGADFTAKIADVGLAKLQHHDYLSLSNAGGTFTWSAPEVLMGERCTEKVDIFSFGVVLWEIVTGEKPARGRLRDIRVPEECPVAVRDLVAQCMDADPGARPSAREVVAILGQPESILERPLPSRRTPAAQATKAADTISTGMRQTLQRITTQLASIVYGGEQGVQQKGWRPADVSNITQKVDISLWSDSVDAMAQCLRHPDVGDQRSPSYKRLRSIDLLCVEVFRLKMADNPAWTEMLRNTAPTTPTAALGGTVDRPAAVDMNHVLDALQLTPRQLRKIQGRWQRLSGELEEIAKERQKLVAIINRIATEGNDPSSVAGYAGVVEVTLALKASMTKQGTASNNTFLAVLDMLTPLQQARLAVESSPFIWDPLALAELVHRQAAGDTAEGSDFLGRTSGPALNASSLCATASGDSDKGLLEQGRRVSLGACLQSSALDGGRGLLGAGRLREPVSGLEDTLEA